MTLQQRLIAVVFALGFSVPAAFAAQPVPLAAGKIEFHVCRVPGMDTSSSYQTIEIPAGTEYDESHPALEDADAAQPAKPRPFLSVVTTEAEALPANGYCVTVPVKPRGDADEAAIRASVGAMFEPNANWRKAAAQGPINLTYGYWQSAQD